jgi:hypothetical protein
MSIYYLVITELLWHPFFPKEMFHFVSLQFPFRMVSSPCPGASPLQVQSQIIKRAGRPEVLLYRSARDGDGDVGTLSILEQ